MWKAADGGMSWSNKSEAVVLDFESIVSEKYSLPGARFRNERAQASRTALEAYASKWIERAGTWY